VAGLLREAVFRPLPPAWCGHGVRAGGRIAGGPDEARTLEDGGGGLEIHRADGKRKAGYDAEAGSVTSCAVTDQNRPESPRKGRRASDSRHFANRYSIRRMAAIPHHRYTKASR